MINSNFYYLTLSTSQFFANIHPIFRNLQTANY